MDYTSLSRINDSQEVLKVKDSTKKVHATEQDVDTFYSKLSTKGFAEIQRHTLNGEEVFNYYLNGDKVATFFPEDESLYIYNSFEHPEFLADAEDFRSSNSYYYDLKEKIEELLKSSGVSQVEVGYTPSRPLPYGYFNYPSIRVKSYEEVSGLEIDMLKDILSDIDGIYVTNASKDFADFYITFDSNQCAILEKLLSLRSINDAELNKKTILTADQVAKIDTEFFECPESCITQSELGHTQLYWHKEDLVATLDKQTMELSYTKSFADNIQTSLEEKEDFMDKVEITDSEDAEVIAETLIRAEDLVDEIGSVLFEETGKDIHSYVKVDYDEDNDAIRVAVDSSVGDAKSNVLESYQREFGDGFYVTDFVSEETPVFYICFDRLTADKLSHA